MSKCVHTDLLLSLFGVEKCSETADCAQRLVTLSQNVGTTCMKIIIFGIYLSTDLRTVPKRLTTLAKNVSTMYVKIEDSHFYKVPEYRVWKLRRTPYRIHTVRIDLPCTVEYLQRFHTSPFCAVYPLSPRVRACIDNCCARMEGPFVRGYRLHHQDFH